MIPNNVNRGTVTNNMQAVASRKLTVDAENMQHIMGLLTNIYSDEEMACLREYATNGFDAQRDAGYDGPVLISTPTRLAPFLTIKDRGTGMSAETLLDLYTSYGKSTKRENADANGFMGIGGKSALAYGNQFSIVTVKDGIRTSASVSRAADDTAELDIIESVESDDPNGTTITIPAQIYNRFDEKAQRLFKFWAPGTVLINGKEPDRSEFEQMTDRIFFHEGDNDIIVMGNVPYPLDDEYDISARGRKIAVYVTMNGEDEVVIHPSRERLIYNPITTNVLAGIKEEYTEKVKVFVTEKIDNATSYAEAWRLIKKYREDYGTKALADVKYNGADLDDEEFKQSDGRPYVYTRWQVTKSRDAVWSYPMRMGALVNESVKAVVVGYTGSGVSSVNKARLKQFFSNAGVTFGYGATIALYSGASLPEPDKTGGIKVYVWSDILKATKSVRTSSGTGFSYGGRYDIWDENSEQWKIDHAPTDAEILYFSHKDEHLTSEIRDRILKDNPDVLFVRAYSNRHAKLQREYPNAKPYRYHEWTSKFAKEDFDALLKDTKKLELLRMKYVYRADSYYDRSGFGLENIPAHMVDQIEDPEYRAAAALANTPEPVVGWAEKVEGMRKLRAQWDIERNAIPQDQRWANKYPLMDWRNRSKDTLQYVNMMYANNKEN
jgi:hypothetical protein